MDRFLAFAVVLLEFIHDLLRRYLTLLLGNRLNDIGKFLVHSLRKPETIECIHDERHAALAGLAVDAHDWFVLSADIRRVDRKVRDLPVLLVSLVHGLHALVDGILMGTGERGKDELSCVRMSRFDLHLGAPLTYVHDLADILQI